MAADFLLAEELNWNSSDNDSDSDSFILQPNMIYTNIITMQVVTATDMKTEGK